MEFDKHKLRDALLGSSSVMACAIAALSMAEPARAQNVLPTQGVVSSGSASIHSSSAALTVNQTSPRAIVNWSSFSIGQSNAVTFNQPNAFSAILNRVTGSTTSTIAGQLDANGQVYIVNPNGIAITRTGAVRVGGGFVASTLPITDGNFNSGNLSFTGQGASAGVSNAGTINAASGGFVGLLGGTVSNSGAISVPLGKVGLGSAEQATLNLTGDNFLQVALPTGAKTADGKALVDVSGKVSAAGGSVQLKAATVATAIRDAVNVSGVVSARSARASGGSIILGGGPGGDVSVTGRLDASGRARGGLIAVGGHDVALRQAKLVASSAKGRGGSVAVTGTNAVSLASSSVSAYGATGGGAIRIGGDFRGSSDVTSVQTTTIDSASALNASATASGDGGTVAVLSTGSTTVHGLISAQAGPQGGNGGQIETSGATVDFAGLSVNASAPHGKAGTWLLDPEDIVIEPPDAVTISDVLNGGTNVTDTTTANSASGIGGISGPGVGDITVAGPISWSTAAVLTLSAYHSIIFNAPMTISGAGNLSLTTNNNVGGTSSGGALTFTMGQGSVQFTAPPTELSPLTINGAVYNLVYDMTGVGGMNGSSGHYAMAGPIDASSPSPLPSSPVASFGGDFEGLGNKISNLTIMATGNVATGASTSLGLFGLLNPGGTIENLGLVGGSVINDSTHTTSNPPGEANASVGELVGFNNGGTITNVYATGSVSGGSETQSSVGGLVGGMGALFGGPAVAGTITNSYATGAVSGSGASGGASSIGGLVGLSTTGSSITNSYATGAVTGSGGFTNVGGLVGENNGSTITGVYATGTVSVSGGGSAVGGLVGYNDAGSTIAGSDASGAISESGGANSIGGLVGTNDASSITNDYATGNVTSNTFGSNVGGLVGFNTAAGAITGSHAIGTISATGEPDCDSCNYNIGGLVGYNDTGSIITDSYATGAVSAKDSATVGGLVGYNDGTINTVNATTYVSGAVTGGDGADVGGLVGYNDTSGAITNAYASGAVIGGDSEVGGLAGYNVGSISASFATGTVSGGADAAVGGLVGVNDSETTESGTTLGSITNSHATGAVSGGPGADVGGLVGDNYGSISGSYATGAVSSAGDADASDGSSTSITVGGLVGYNDGTIGGNSYATGTVSATGAATCPACSIDVGGLVGENDTDGSITSAHAAGTVSATGAASGGGGQAAGGLVGVNNGAIRDSAYATGAVSVTGSVGGGSSSFAGGLAGMNGGTIANAYATGAVSATGTISGGASSVGGLVGLNNTTITDAYATGAVTGGTGANTGGVGGLVGQNGIGGGSTSATSITDAYATGAVGGGAGDNIGGLVGIVYAPSTITDAYATGAVSGGAGASVGGLVGKNVGGAITDAYWDTGTTGQSSSAGGLGMTTAQLQAVLPTFQNPGNWGIVAGKSYPYLCFEFAGCTVTPQVVSGVVYSDQAGVTPAAGGLIVDALLNGAALNSAQTGGAVATGANGYYYYLLASGSIPANGAVLTYSNGEGSVNGAALADQIASGYGPNADIFANTLHIITPAAAYSTAKADLTTTLGDNGPVSAFVGSLADLTLDASNAFTIDQPISYASGVMTATAKGNLTIGAGGSLAANSVTLATTSNFLNQAGAGAISLQGSGGRWLVYSTNPNLDTDGGLTPAFYQYAATYTIGADSGTAPAAPGNGFLYIYAPTITITDVTKTYDATTALPNNAADYATSGANSGDSVTLNLSSVTGSYATPNAGSGIDVTLTTAPTVVASRGGVPVYGYAVAAVTNDPIGTIDPKALTASLIGPVEKTYDGTTAATLAPGNYSLVGFVPGQTATVTQTVGTYASPNAGTGIGVSATLTAGDFTAGAGTLLTNYVLPTSASGNVGVIDPKALTFSVANAIGIYGTTATLGPASLSGIVPGDVVDPTVGAFFGPIHIIPNPLTPPGAYLQDVTALSNPNYSIATSGNLPGVLTIINSPELSTVAPSLVYPGSQLQSGPAAAAAAGAAAGLGFKSAISCDAGPLLSAPRLYSDPANAVKALSNMVSQFIEQCERPTQANVADALDQYADALAKVAPSFPPELRNLPTIVHEAARRVRAAPNKAAAVAVLRQTVATIRKEISLVRSEDPDVQSRQIRDGEAVAETLTVAGEALVNSGGL